jgi:surface polysaccharide O-acyltransferase-like enzyme
MKPNKKTDEIPDNRKRDTVRPLPLQEADVNNRRWSEAEPADSDPQPRRPAKAGQVPQADFAPKNASPTPKYPGSQQTQPQAQTQRLPFPDFLKAVAILLVVIYHCRPPADLNFLQTPSLLNYLDYSFFTFLGLGVPLFFLVNGMLLLNRPLNIPKHYAKMFRLALLGLVWACMTMFFLRYYREHLLGRADARYSTSDTLRAVLFFQGSWLTHLWFIKALVAIHILAPLVKLAYDYSKSIFLHTFFFVFLFTFVLNFALKIAEFCEQTYFLKATVADYNIFAYHYSFALAYFMAGGLFSHYKDKLKTTRVKFFSIIGILLGTLGTMFYGIAHSQRTGLVHDTVFMEYGSIFTFAGVLGLATLALAYKGAENIPGKLIRTIGVNSLGIYFLHIPLLDPVRSLARAVSLTNGLWANLLIAFVVLFLSLGICLTLKKVPVVRELFKI